MPRESNLELATKLREVLADLESALGNLKGVPSSIEEAALERWLQLGIQLSMDLGDRILTSRGVDEPPRARDIFDNLASLGVLTKQQSAQMVRLVSLRNQLVHDYGEFTAATTPALATRALAVLQDVAKALTRSLPE